MFVRLLGVTLAGLSAACTAHWLWGLGLAKMGLIGAGGTALGGLLIEGAKFTLKPRNWVYKVGLAVATVMSLAATYIYLDSTLADDRAGTITITRLAGEIKNVDWRIERQRQDISSLAEDFGIITTEKAVAARAVLENLEQERSDLLKEQAQVQQEQASDFLLQFSQIIFGSFAVLVDLMAFLCLAEARRQGSDEVPVVPEVEEPPVVTSFPAGTPVLEEPLKEPVPEVKEPVKEPSQEPLFEQEQFPEQEQEPAKPEWEPEEVKRRILQEHLDPTVAAIRNVYGGKHPRAKAVLDELLRDGKLRETGNRRRPYELVRTKVTPLRRT